MLAAHQAAKKVVLARSLTLPRSLGACGGQVAGDLPRPVPEDLVDVARVLDNFYIPTCYPNGHLLW